MHDCFGYFTIDLSGLVVGHVDVLSLINFLLLNFGLFFIILIHSLDHQCLQLEVYLFFIFKNFELYVEVGIRIEYEVKA